MSWKITFVGVAGTEMHATDQVVTPEGKKAASTLQQGDLVQVGGMVFLPVDTIEEV